MAWESTDKSNINNRESTRPMPEPITFRQHKVLLFDSVVMPIALYGCEVFFLSIDLLEKLHLLFCKMILKVNKSTTTCMVL